MFLPFTADDFRSGWFLDWSPELERSPPQQDSRSRRWPGLRRR